jgi:hypothetical protein
MSLANIAFALALILSGQISPAKKPTKSARVGDLLITATRVWLPQDLSNKIVAYPDRDHLVAVEVTVKNVSERISQTNSLSPSLKVKPYAEYPWYPWTRTPSGVAKPPNLYQLLPGEESSGGYVFEVRNGTTPIALVLECDIVPPWPSTRIRREKSSIELAGFLENQSAK